MKKKPIIPTNYPLLREYMSTHSHKEESILKNGHSAREYQVEDWKTFIPLWEEFRKYSPYSMPALPGSRYPAQLDEKTLVLVNSPFHINEEMDDTFMEAWETTESYQEFLRTRG